MKALLAGLLFLTFFSLSSKAAEYSFNYTPACAQAYHQYLALKPISADGIIEREILAHPYNLLPIYLSDYGDFLTLLLNGDPHERAERAGHESERIRLINLGDDHDPWKRLCLAGVHVHWAIIHIRFGEQLKAAMAFRKSYLLLKENTALFPDFAPNKVLYGAEEAIAGTIPDEYNWLMSIFGTRGSLSEGSARLNAYLKENRTGSPMYEEAQIYDLYIRFYLQASKASAWKEVSSDTQFDVKDNLLRAFIRTNLALSYRKADYAYATLQQAYTIPGIRNYPVFDYEMGCTQLLRLQPDCVRYLESFVSRNKGKLFNKDALQKAAFANYLQGNTSKAESFRQTILKAGSLNTDADRQAQRFAKNGTWPNPLLLMVRLMIDGGYYQQALQKLQATNLAAFSTIPDQLEYNFRLGRALEENGDAVKAVQVYQQVINKGKERPEYFAARSALQMAGIYELRSQFQEAKTYYELCLSMKDHDFQSSIDQQAKAGLNRLNHN